MPCYRFSDFLVSPKRRIVVQNGRELPLIPRYFDLLVLLIERRHEAVHRREIFDRVWNDVIVSDSALNQAIRTIRRTLGDDSREPRFVRTVSRHGYRFVFPDVVETEDEGVLDTVPVPQATNRDTSPARAADDYEALLNRLTQIPETETDAEEQREAAELLHALGTSESLRRLGTRPGHERARALLRDTRWDSPTAEAVPLRGAPNPLRVAVALVTLRLRRAARLAARRSAGASVGAGLAGLIAGGLGGLLLAALPESDAPPGIIPVLAFIGAACGAAGGAGVGAGLSGAETAARSRHALVLVLGAALGGGIVGLVVQWIVRWSLEALVGLNLDIGGGVEGLAVGGAAGLGYAWATRGIEGGMAAPRGRRRIQTAALTAALCGLAALALTVQGRPLVGGTVHLIARAAQGSQVSLAPLGRLVGEPDFGSLSQAIIGFGEGALFGFGLALGLTKRGRGSYSRTSHTSLIGR